MCIMHRNDKWYTCANHFNLNWENPLKIQNFQHRSLSVNIFGLEQKSTPRLTFKILNPWNFTMGSILTSSISFRRTWNTFLNYLKAKLYDSINSIAKLMDIKFLDVFMEWFLLHLRKSHWSLFLLRPAYRNGAINSRGY